LSDRRQAIAVGVRYPALVSVHTRPEATVPAWRLPPCGSGTLGQATPRGVRPHMASPLRVPTGPS
jgi:hypothetical protein